MAGKSKPVPEGIHTITAQLIVSDAGKAIEFYKRAFGAEARGEAFRMPNGKVGHAELKIGDSVVMLADEFPGAGTHKAPQTAGGTTVVLNLYVPDVDKLFNQAVSAGAKVAMPLENQFWGDRYGQVEDPFGHKWALASHVEDLSREEIGKRANEFFAKMAQGRQAGA